MPRRRIGGRKRPRRRRPLPSGGLFAGEGEILLSLVPIAERAELMAQAARHLGLTDDGPLLAAMRRARVPIFEGSC